MDAETIARRFNDAINRRDLSALMALVTDDHRFVDAAGNVTAGRGPVEEAWEGFFRAFPDYTNHFDRVVQRHGDVVVMLGRSTCPSTLALDGPAIWTAEVRDGRVREWRVYDDEPILRTDLLGE